ncbi:ADP ribosylation factor interacting protein 2 [Chelydra serpentina]|uniref:ADP ribosylation factor interacting protein 2 n=1 Tax=Chelydra serpentina TaxID=8475 RepID=A0A8T1RWS8_CHESE|nr:ADP ribosylation factor interacting protein 2 [Chelydra serpentina]
MTDGLMSKAATMEIPINGTGDTGSLPEDDGLEQDLQQVMVSGPNLNETSIVSGGYGGTAEGIIPTSTVKGPAVRYNASFPGLRLLHAQGGSVLPPRGFTDWLVQELLSR